jgi:outer membrane protein TolC
MVMLLPVMNVKAEEEARSLTVRQAVELALQNSNQLRIHQREVEASKVGVREADEARKNARSSISQPNTVLMSNGYFLRQAEMSQRLAEKQVSDFRRQLELQVMTEYYNLKAAIDTRERAYLARQYANENLWTVSQMVLRGTATFLDNLQAATVKLRADADREAARRNVMQAQRVFNVTLGLPMNTQLTLTDELPVAMKDLPLPDDIMEQALANRMDVMRARESAELEEFGMRIFDLYIPKNMFAYQQRAISTATVLENRDMIVANATLAIYRMYNDVLGTQANVRVARETMEQAHQAYMVAIVRYDIGMIHSSDLLNALGSWKDSMIGFEAAKLAYATALANYEALL